MWIQVRTMDGKTSHRIDDLSKLTKIEELRILLVEKFGIPVDQQRLFYRGKQMEDGYTLFDYNVGLNDLVQILAKSVPSNDKPSTSNEIQTIKKEKLPDSVASNLKGGPTSKYFKIGASVDGEDIRFGAWFEGEVIYIQVESEGGNEQPPHITTQAEKNVKISENFENDGLLYTVKFYDNEINETLVLPLSSIRPRAEKVLKFEDIKIGDKVMVNYNIVRPTERGYWYDGAVTEKSVVDNKNELVVSLITRLDELDLERCVIKFTDEIYAIEKISVESKDASVENKDASVENKDASVENKDASVENRDSSVENKDVSKPIDVEVEKAPSCTKCNDDSSKKCKECSCCVCGGKDSPEKQIICDECDHVYHIWCLAKPLDQVPDVDDWYCPDCKNDETEVVKAGEKLKNSKKKSKMPSANSNTRDWGKGMACVGRTKVCTLVRPNHFGPIPNVEVGTMWLYRMQVSESGVHRPPVGGIHGKENEGAYSLVLAGGYEDDLDDGEEFLYTGSGGRDLSGNKRCAAQSCDQTLTRMNKALALNCKAPLNKNGAEAVDWKKGKPVRVVRNFKGQKHSKYSPKEGNRYDGIYKVVKYWLEEGKSGFKVWRYLIRRDDPTPAPWTEEGKKRIEELGLELQVPDGYEASKKKSLQSSKRSRSDDESSDEEKPSKKKTCYKLPKEKLDVIKKDTLNKKLWDECLESVEGGLLEFLKKVEESFQCICCQELVYKPVTTPCLHNICKECLKRSFGAKIFTCPMCRELLSKDACSSINSALQSILNLLFPGIVI